MTTPNEELILKLRGQAYTTCRPDQLCDQAADLLQSLAERIAELEDGLKEMESKVDYWREQHADLGLKYDNLLQAFHIAETDVKLWKGTAKKARVEALNEAKQAAENCDVVEAKGNTYYAQLGDAAATLRGIVAAIEALKGK